MFTREAIDTVKNYFTVGRSHFSPELMILCVRQKLRVVEIPVHYQPRVGESKITGDVKKAIRLGLIMIGLICRYRFKRTRSLILAHPAETSQISSKVQLSVSSSFRRPERILSEDSCQTEGVLLESQQVEAIPERPVANSDDTKSGAQPSPRISPSRVESRASATVTEPNR
jgi:hypothetical protein